MTPLQYETLMIKQMSTPMRPHTIELLEPIERVWCVEFCWAGKWFSEGSPFKPTDVYQSTLGLDGVDSTPAPKKRGFTSAHGWLDDDDIGPGGR